MNATKIKADKSVAMREANALVKSNHLTRSDAMRQGYKVAKIYALFAAGAIATFTFTKADGTIREAHALPSTTGEYLVKGTGTHHTPKANILFCDADLGGAFRSCVKANILTVAA